MIANLIRPAARIDNNLLDIVADKRTKMRCNRMEGAVQRRTMMELEKPTNNYTKRILIPKETGWSVFATAKGRSQM
jgi:hypothetical protein